MKITINELKRIIKKFIISEIKRTNSLTNIGYNEFVNWAKEEADKVTSDIEEYNDLKFQWSEEAGEVKLIIYNSSDEPFIKINDDYPNAIGYIAFSKFNDGYKIGTLGVKANARGGIASKAYDFIISKKTKKLYSDKMQTPEARKLWVKLYNKFTIKAIDDNGVIFDVKPNRDGSELQLASDDINNNSLYSEDENNLILFIQN
jgi:hypothetical protein